VYCGFRPAFIMTKNTTLDNQNWVIMDSTRDPYNTANKWIYPNERDQEISNSSTLIDILSNGFKLKASSGTQNNSNNTYIFMAFAEKPETPASRVTITKPDLKVNDMQSIYIDRGRDFRRTITQEGNRKQWTFSCWVKLDKHGNDYNDYDGLDARMAILCSGESGGGNDSIFQAGFLGDGGYQTGLNAYYIARYHQLKPNLNEWFHYMLRLDTPNSDSIQRYQTFINGISLDSYGTSVSDDNRSDKLGNAELGINREGVTQRLFHLHSATSLCYGGYVANIHMIDGQVLEPSAFTETVDGVLVPKQYEGTYGTNGYHLDFAPENMEYDGDEITRVLDESPNSNHWTAH